MADDLRNEGLKNRFKGRVKEGEGQLREKIGDLRDDPREELKGKAQQVKGKMQGKLGEADYTSLRAKYETKALGILQHLQAVGKPMMQPDERLLHLPNNGCPQCGEPLGSGDKFCRSCGTPLGARCGTCGAALAADDKFCAYCGVARTALPAVV